MILILKSSRLLLLCDSFGLNSNDSFTIQKETNSDSYKEDKFHSFTAQSSKVFDGSM